MAGENAKAGSVIDPVFAITNYVEAGFWSAIGVGFAIASIRSAGLVRRRCIFAAIVFMVFGGSDVVEAHTSAWWRPWWLLVWKAACVVALIALLIAHLRQRPSQPTQTMQARTGNCFPLQ